MDLFSHAWIDMDVIDVDCTNHWITTLLLWNYSNYITALLTHIHGGSRPWMQLMSSMSIPLQVRKISGTWLVYRRHDSCRFCHLCRFHCQLRRGGGYPLVRMSTCEKWEMLKTWLGSRKCCLHLITKTMRNIRPSGPWKGSVLFVETNKLGLFSITISSLTTYLLLFDVTAVTSVALELCGVHRELWLRGSPRIVTEILWC